jgi:hypothetical protein
VLLLFCLLLLLRFVVCLFVCFFSSCACLLLNTTHLCCYHCGCCFPTGTSYPAPPPTLKSTSRVPLRCCGKCKERAPHTNCSFDRDIALPATGCDLAVRFSRCLFVVVVFVVIFVVVVGNLLTHLLLSLFFSLFVGVQ